MFKKNSSTIFHVLIDGFDLWRQLFDTSFFNSLNFLKQDIEAMFILIVECWKWLHTETMLVSSQNAEMMRCYYSH